MSGKWLTGMFADVVDHVFLAAETLVAVLAAEGGLPRVTAWVVLQMFLAVERLGADSALIGLIQAVTARVSLQAARRRKHMETDLPT